MHVSQLGVVELGATLDTTKLDELRDSYFVLPRILMTIWPPLTRCSQESRTRAFFRIRSTPGRIHLRLPERLTQYGLSAVLYTRSA